MKRAIFSLVLLLFILIISSCSDRNDIRSDDQSVERMQIVYGGEYIANDDSTLIITETNGKFDIKIDIVRLTSIDDGIGKNILSSDNEVEFSATDAQENPISGKIYWQNQDEVILEFIDSTWEYLPNGTVFKFYRSNKEQKESGQIDVSSNIEDCYVTYSNEDDSYVPIRSDMLDTTFTGYRNQTGATFFEQTNQNSLDSYYIKKVDGIHYYYGTNEVVIGVKNDEICLFTGYASDVVGHTSPLVRELINALDAGALFEVLPDVIEVNNSYNSQYFFYWKIKNGYIGIVTIGGDDPTKSYGYVANSFVFFENMEEINSVANTVTENIKDVGISVAEASDDYYARPENYEVYSRDDLEFGSDIVLRPDTEVRNFKFFKINDEKYIAESKFEIQEVLFSKDKISSQKPFVVKIGINGPGGPYHGISYIDENGIEKKFVIMESFEDGSFDLVAF